MKKRISIPYPWIVLALFGFGLVVPTYLQFQLSPLANVLSAQYSLTNAQFSSIFTSPMIPGICFALAAGLLTDRFGIRRVICSALCVAMVGAVWRVFADHYYTLFSATMLTGVGIAFLNPNNAKIMSGWFPPEKVSICVGIVAGMGTLGMTLATATTAMLPSVKAAFTIGAVLAVLLALLWLLFMKELPSKPALGNAQPKQHVTMKESLKTVVRCKTVWLAGICMLFMFTGIMQMNTFLPTALHEGGLDLVSAGMYASLFTFGSFFGALTFPALFIKLGRSKILLYSYAVICAAGIAFSARIPAGFFLAAALFITGYASGSFAPLFLALPITIPEIGTQYAGTAGGFIITVQLIGGVVFPTHIIMPLVGNNLPLSFLICGIFTLFIIVIIYFMPGFTDRQASPDDTVPATNASQ